MTTACITGHEEGDRYVERVDRLFEWRCIMVIGGIPVDIGVATTLDERNEFLAANNAPKKGKKK